MIIHLFHWNAGAWRAGSLLFLLGLHARWMRLHTALSHRLDRQMARRLRQHTAHFRLIDGRSITPAGIIGDGAQGKDGRR